MQVRAYFDIGGTGARADAVAIWVCQFVGQKINVLDYYEAQGQELSVHLAWLRSRGWGKAWVILPHDGAHGDKVFATSYESAIREAGFDVFVIPNQGQGAASARIETARRLFPRVFFNKDTTEEGREALGWYHEKKSTDPERNIGLGPNHDWSSHCADAFGLMCIHYDQPDGAPPARQRYRASADRVAAAPGKAHDRLQVELDLCKSTPICIIRCRSAMLAPVSSADEEARMIRFYFHLRAGADLITDQEGTECPDVEGARVEAMAAARYILADAIKSGAESFPEAFVITDSEGCEVGTLALASVLPKQLQH